tara:strand:+ start:1053 stop:1355 length:303 start_codon:yes stop_codon:yes gene_type:complete
MIFELVGAIASIMAFGFSVFTWITFGHKISRLFNFSLAFTLLGSLIHFVFRSLPYFYNGDIHAEADHQLVGEIFMEFGIAGILLSVLRFRMKRLHELDLG